LALLDRLFATRDPRLAIDAFGLRFPNPIGLAAGLDKNAEAPAAFAALGFGMVEIGTVTPKPQAGNPKPRMFRLPEDDGLINRMGFPSGGAAHTRNRLWPWRHGLPGGAVLGVNLGKNASTPVDEAAQDYVATFDALHDLVTYAVINVSSPNTPGLRALQTRDNLLRVASTVVARRDLARTKTGRRVPILVKISPDLDEAGLADVVGAALDASIDGLIATNTTLMRPALRSTNSHETGGLSGAPLRDRATQVLRWLVREAGARLPIVAAGGIMGPDDVMARLDVGAVLVQAYTGVVYAGPGFAGQACASLMAHR
jgi:dihydroorotate dehydrogenase